MNFLTTFFEQDSLNRWTTLALTQLWQVTLLIIVVGLIVKLFCRHRPHVAYLLWLVVIAKCLTPPLWSSPTSPFSWALREPIAETMMIVPAETKPSPMQNTKSFRFNASLPLEYEEDKIKPHSGIAAVEPPIKFEIKPHHIVLACAIVWIAGCIVISAVIAWKWLAYRRFLRLSTVESSSGLRDQLAQLSKQLGVRRTARVHCVDAVCCPSLFGIFLPQIVLPTSITRNSRAEELQPILAHELIHIRRGDLAISYLQLLVQTLYWFHPLVWWANREMRRERERCCDEEVIATLNLEPKKYANLLVSLLESIKQSRTRFAPAGVTMFGFTKRRLEHLVRRDAMFRARTPKVYWLAVVVALAIVLPGSGLAQSKAAKKIMGDESAANRISQDTRSKLKGDIQLEHIEALDVTVVKGHPDDVALVTKDLQKEEPKKEKSLASTPKTATKDGAIDTFEGYVRGIDSVNIKSGVQDPESRLETPVIKKLREQGAEFTLHPDKSGRMFVVANLIPWKESEEGWKLLHEINDLEGFAFSPAKLKRESLQQFTTFPNLREYIVNNVNDEQFASVPFTKKITGLMIQADSLTDKSLRKLAEHESLENLVIHSTEIDVFGVRKKQSPPDITDTGLRSISMLKNLRTLSLSSLSNAKGIGIESFTTLINLSEIDIGLLSLDEAGMKGLAKLKQIKKLNLRESKIPSAAYANLQKLENLEYLSISSAMNFDDQAVTSLSQLKKLKWLSLHNMKSSLSDKGLMAIKDLSELRVFSLSIPRTQPKIERSSLAYIKNLKKLQSIHIHDIKLDNQSMENFRDLNDLRQIQILGEFDISDDSLKNLSQMTKLIVLDLNNINLKSKMLLTDDCLVHLKDMKEMVRIWLQGAKITGKGLSNLNKMSKLVSLFLDSPIEDLYVRELATLTKLEQLHLENSRLTDAAVDDLVKLPLVNTLDLRGSKISDVGAEKLSKVKRLRFLSVQKTKVSKAWVEKSRKQNKKLHIAYSENDGAGFLYIGDLDGDTDDGKEPKGPSAVREYSEEEFKAMEKRSNGLTDDESKDSENKNAKPADEKKPEKTSSNDSTESYDGVIKGLDSQRFSFGNEIPQSRLESPEFTELNKQGAKFTVSKDKQGKLFVVANIERWRESEAGWKQLAQIPDLQGLSFVPRLFKKQSLVHLSELPALREVMISMVRDEDFLAFPSLKNLTGLVLDGATFTDKTLEKLSEYKSLETLYLWQFQETKTPVPTVSDDGLAKLADLPNLRTLNIQGFYGQNGKFFEKLAALKNFREMELNFESLDDEGMKSVSKLTRLKKLTIGTAKTTPAGWQSLNTMTNLESFVVMRSSDIDDQAMIGFSKFKNLRVLALPNMSSNLTEKGLSAIKELKELRTLIVSFERSSASLNDLAFLRPLTKMRNLTVHGVIVNDSSIESLKDLTDLKQLTLLTGPDLTDDSLKTIGHFKKLEVLHIDAPQLSDNCLNHLKDLPSLVSLSLTGKKITGKGLRDWPQMPSLRFLDLAGSPIEDAYAKEFLRFPKLEQLRLMSSKFSDNAVEDLIKLPAMRELELSNSGISDKEIEKFARIKSLTRIDLLNTQVTKAGMERLQNLNPYLQIRVEISSNAGTLTLSGFDAKGEFSSSTSDIDLNQNGVGQSPPEKKLEFK